MWPLRHFRLNYIWSRLNHPFLSSFTQTIIAPVAALQHCRTNHILEELEKKKGKQNRLQSICPGRTGSLIGPAGLPSAVRIRTIPLKSALFCTKRLKQVMFYFLTWLSTSALVDLYEVRDTKRTFLSLYVLMYVHMYLRSPLLICFLKKKPVFLL